MKDSKTVFRSTMGEPVHVALTTGHSVVVPVEGKPIASRFHRAATLAGCLPVNAETYEDPSVREPAENRDSLITEGIQKMLESSDPKAFTSSNQPNLNVLAGVIGFRPEKEEVLGAWKKIEASLTGGDSGDSDNSDNSDNSDEPDKSDKSE